MIKTGKPCLAVFLACMILAGCKAPDKPAEAEMSPPLSSETEAPVPSRPDAPAEEAEDAPEEPRPIYGNQLQDGTYKIEVSSSSSMFRITDAQLTVADGEMSALLTLSGTGYEKLYMGTGGEAAAAADDQYIYFKEDADGKYTYQVPVAALDFETACAAWSIRKKTWYDRTLVFQSGSIPPEAFLPVSADPAQMPADGRYMIGVTLSGGTGRAEVASPALLVIQGGAATATVVWSSPYYDRMSVNGAFCDPVGSGGNSTFQIPVILDRDMAVSARTIAMSTPHEIDYTLRFDSGTLEQAEKK